MFLNPRNVFSNHIKCDLKFNTLRFNTLRLTHYALTHYVKHITFNTLVYPMVKCDIKQIIFDFDKIKFDFSGHTFDDFNAHLTLRKSNLIIKITHLIIFSHI